MAHAHEGPDRRVYLARKDFEVAVKSADAALFCHRSESLEGGFHLITDGEIYVHSEDVAYCLNCAVALAIATVDRPNLDRGNRIPPNPVPPTPTL